MTGPLFDLDPPALEYAKWFLFCLQQAHPKMKLPTEAAFGKWADAARLMIQRDGRTLDEMAELGTWLFESQGSAAAFWRSVILSLPKFRMQWDKLDANRRYEESERNRRRPARGGVMDAAQRILARGR